MQDLEKVGSSNSGAGASGGSSNSNATNSNISGTNSSNTGTLRHSHKKNRPAPQPPGKPQPDLQIRDPSQLLVGVPSTLTAQWRHQPHALVTGTLTYHARVSDHSSRMSDMLAGVNTLLKLRFIFPVFRINCGQGIEGC